MWKIKHIFDGEYGCEETNQKEQFVSVTIENENNETKIESVPDAWLRKNNLDIGSVWPDYSDFMIETKDLLLKKASKEDYSDIYYNLWSQPISAKYMLWEVTRSEKEALERLEKTMVFQKYHKYAFFIYEKSTGKAIGFAGMKEIEKGVYEDTGIAFGPDFVGKGYGTQVLHALMEEAHANGAYKFVASCRKKNIASHKLQMRCGFAFSHEEERVDPRDGQPYVLEFNEFMFE